MLLLKMIVLFALAGWIIAITGRRLRRTEFGKWWRISLIVFSSVGLVVGTSLLNVRYLVTSTSRAYGFPFVIAGGDFVDGRWLDGGVGHYLLFATLADLAVGLAFVLLPLSVASFVYQFRRSRTSSRS